MATANDIKEIKTNTITKTERDLLVAGLDKHIASLSRFNAKEPNTAIKDIREKEMNASIMLKNKLMTKELEL